jgi:hypothetical protein
VQFLGEDEDSYGEDSSEQTDMSTLEAMVNGEEEFFQVLPTGSVARYAHLVRNETLISDLSYTLFA